MERSTETRACLALLILTTLGATPGCATPRLLEAGMLTERAVAYRSAWTDGKRLWIRYETETIDAGGKARHTGVRTASLALADTDVRRGLAIDAFPVEHLGGGMINARGLRALDIRMDSRGSDPILLVMPGDERHEGFRLLRVEGQPAAAHFHSGALVEPHSAWWAYPLMPLALLYDAVAAPVLLLLATPFIAGD